MQRFFGHPLEADRPHVRVLDLVIQQDVAEFPKQFELFIGRVCDGLAEFFQLLLGFTMTVPYTLIKKLHGNVGVMQQCLLEEGNEDRVTPLRCHALQILIGGFPANLRQPFRPVRIETGEVPLVQPLHLGESRSYLASR